jgi:hypothetical protein
MRLGLVPGGSGPLLRPRAARGDGRARAVPLPRRRAGRVDGRHDAVGDIGARVTTARGSSREAAPRLTHLPGRVPPRRVDRASSADAPGRSRTCDTRFRNRAELLVRSPSGTHEPRSMRAPAPITGDGREAQQAVACCVPRCAGGSSRNEADPFALHGQERLRWPGGRPLPADGWGGDDGAQSPNGGPSCAHLVPLGGRVPSTK